MEEKMKDWFKIIMSFFVAHFIIITGVFTIPRLTEVSSSTIISFSYSLSILFSAVYFTYLGIDELFKKYSLGKQRGKQDG